jgi:hypothetical protein
LPDILTVIKYTNTTVITEGITDNNIVIAAGKLNGKKDIALANSIYKGEPYG